MPVQRFRTFDDARRALWAEADDPQLGMRIRRLWRFSARFVPHCIPRGVRKFRSVEEAGREREEWIRERVRILHADRQG